MSQSMCSTRRRGYLDKISPPTKRDSSAKENDIPVLSLMQFSKAPLVTFAFVKLGTSKSALLRVDNPTDGAADVRVEKMPSSKGFSVDHSGFTIQPGSHFILTITWTPSEEGGVRELVIFNANGVLRHQAVVLGRAAEATKKKILCGDLIKNKRAGDQSVAPRGQKTGPTLKIASKTFQVPRHQPYTHGKPRSPLSFLNEGERVREGPLKCSPIELPVLQTCIPSLRDALAIIGSDLIASPQDFTFPIHSLTPPDMVVRNVGKTEGGKRRVAAVLKEKSVQEKSV